MTNTKAVIAVADDLATWQRLNVAAFVVSGIGSIHAALVGDTYIDGSGIEYPPMLGIPIRVMTGTRGDLRRAFQRALDRGMTVSPFIEEMFLTGNDADNRAAVAAARTDSLNIVGLAIVGDPRDVDKAADKLGAHP